MSYFQAAAPQPEELCHPSFSAPGAAGSLRVRGQIWVNIVYASFCNNFDQNYAIAWG